MYEDTKLHLKHRGFPDLVSHRHFPGCEKKTPCDAPEYFGICDTFVPGTRIAGRDRQPILVSSTWPGGPADRCGICAGDQIVSVNGVLFSDSTFNRMLQELVSASPTLVSLKVLRGNENLEFSVPRVRESTLAYLSNQKFLRKQLVPLEQTAEGMDEIERFRDRALAGVGYRSAGTEFVPRNTPDTQVQRFIDLLDSISAPERIPTPSLSPVTTRIFENREGFSAGFAALVLKAPDEVWIRTVIPGSPAQKAGLFPGDQLIELDGKPIKGMKKEDLEKHILQPDVPRAIVLKLMRGRRVSKIVIRTQKFREFELHVGFP